MTFAESAKRSGKSDILLVLDTNEFIFGLTGTHKPSALLLDLIGVIPGLRVSLPSTVITETTHNLGRIHSRLIAAFTDLVYTHPLFAVLPDENTPEDLINQYVNLGLPQEDAVIGAFAHWVKADFLVSENQHFLKDLRTTAYDVLSAEAMISRLLT